MFEAVLCLLGFFVLLFGFCFTFDLYQAARLADRRHDDGK